MIRDFTVTVVSGNGPAAAVTPVRRAVAPSSAALARVTVAATCAPCCLANAWLNGVLESTSMLSASVEAAVETSSTTPMTMAWTFLPDRPPRAARMAGIAFIAAPRSGCWQSLGRR